MRARTRALSCLLALAPAGCLLPSGGVVEPDSSTGDDTGSSTVDPTTGAPDDSSSSGEAPTTEGPEPVCGDGEQNGDEQCDDGPANADDAACTLECKTNVCGDGHLLAGVETCDDGPANADDAACTSTCAAAVCGDGLVLADGEACDDGKNDGSYGSCAADCSAQGPHCGDGVVDEGEEECDDDDPSCLGCLVATSCLKIHEADPALPSGARTIYPVGPTNGLEVFCDMESDGGGYTFLKVDIDSELNDLPYPAKKAESTCASYGMHLLVPRSPAHLISAHGVATIDNVLPVGGGGKTSGPEYLQILGIYPAMAGESCLGAALTPELCPEWVAGDGGPWYISDVVKNVAEPDPEGACPGCSMLYTWNADASVKNYKTLPNPGGSSLRFMCDVGDKLP